MSMNSLLKPGRYVPVWRWHGREVGRERPPVATPIVMTDSNSMCALLSRGGLIPVSLCGFQLSLWI